MDACAFSIGTYLIRETLFNKGYFYIIGAFYYYLFTKESRVSVAEARTIFI